ncbi:unnamed protein product, partial [Mesorhabditis spiculigera]
MPGIPFQATLTSDFAEDAAPTYIKIKLIKHKRCENYWLVKSWGRVSSPWVQEGENCRNFGSLDDATAGFRTFFYEKTGNKWANRVIFDKKRDKMSYMPEETGTDNSLARCKLRAPVADLIRKVFSEEFLKERMVEFKMSANLMMMDGNTKHRILLAYETLDRLREAVEREQTNERKARIEKDTAVFYDLIAHIDRPPLNTPELIQKKTDQLAELIELAELHDMMTLHGDSGPRHILDQLYDRMGVEIIPLERESAEFNTVQLYMQAGHFHNSCQILEVFSIRRPTEERFFRHEIGNRKLLWHGSQLVNYCGIFTQGLRVAPKEAKHTGHSFGMAIYFSDSFDKSVHYCRAGPGEEALILLCEVALGKIRSHGVRDYLYGSAGEFDSFFVAGTASPDPACDVLHNDGYIIPVGPLKSAVPLVGSLYNEYLVTQTDQVRLRYIMRLRVTEDCHPF